MFPSKTELIEIVYNYCKITSVHGFRYIADPKLSTYKKILWCVFCFSSIFFCCYMVYLQIIQYSSHRITTSVGTTNYPVWDVPFPAITICPFNIIYENRTQRIFKILHANGYSDELINSFFQKFNTLIISDLLDENVNVEEYRSIVEYLEKNDYNTERLMSELTPPCQSMLKKCYWKTQKVNCNEMFKLTRTTEGFCCSFNYNGKLEKDRLIERKHEVAYAGGFGKPFGLKVYLDVDESQYIAEIRPLDGFDVSLHGSYDYPIMALRGISIMPANDVTVTVRPQILASSEDIRQIDINQRRCLFQDERKLLWSEQYNYITCFAECKAKAIRKVCKCDSLLFPAPESAKYCTLLDVPCLKKNEYKYTSMAITDQPIKGNSDGFTLEKHDTSQIHCNCYPQCNQIYYDYDVDVQKLTLATEDSNLSILHIYYNTVGCTQITSNLYITWNSVIASIGGLFGLCVGGSVLSLIELLFYVFNSIICKAFVNRNKNKNQRKHNKISKLQKNLIMVNQAKSAKIPINNLSFIN